MNQESLKVYLVILLAGGALMWAVVLLGQMAGW